MWVRRILIIGPSNIGDALLMGEVIAAAAEYDPDAQLILVVGERAQTLFADDPRVSILLNTDAFDSPLGRLHLALRLWRLRPQLIIDLRHTVYPMLLKPWLILRYLRRPPALLRHMRDRYRWLLRVQAPSIAQRLQGLSSPWLYFSSKDKSQAEHLWGRWQLDGQKVLVMICPGARSHIKRWEATGFAKVADRLIEECRVEIIFSGEPEEEPVVSEILSLMTHRAHSAVGLTTIRQVGLLMQRVSLVVTNDSASLHLASVLQVPTVAIFGPTDPTKYGPTARQSRTIHRRLFCSPCEQSLCTFHHECMRFVRSEEVYEAAAELLGTLNNER